MRYWWDLWTKLVGQDHLARWWWWDIDRLTCHWIDRWSRNHWLFRWSWHGMTRNNFLVVDRTDRLARDNWHLDFRWWRNCHRWMSSRNDWLQVGRVYQCRISSHKSRMPPVVFRCSWKRLRVLVTRQWSHWQGCSWPSNRDRYRCYRHYWVSSRIHCHWNYRWCWPRSGHRNHRNHWNHRNYRSDSFNRWWGRSCWLVSGSWSGGCCWQCWNRCCHINRTTCIVNGYVET